MGPADARERYGARDPGRTEPIRRLASSPIDPRRGDRALADLLEVAPWTQWLTWIFQVMPIFFVVGGFANAASWESARARGLGCSAWVSRRLQTVAPLPFRVATSTQLTAMDLGSTVSPDRISRHGLHTTRTPGVCEAPHSHRRDTDCSTAPRLGSRLRASAAGSSFRPERGSMRRPVPAPAHTVDGIRRSAPCRQRRRSTRSPDERLQNPALESSSPAPAPPWRVRPRGGGTQRTSGVEVVFSFDGGCRGSRGSQSRSPTLPDA
jgi:hypothetical protein